MAEWDRDSVRPGDRYLNGNDKITVSRIEDGIIYYETLTEDGKIWSTRTPLPVPLGWQQVGRGALEPQYCINHPLREREVGTLYCPECVDQNAGGWAELDPEIARATYAALQREDQGHD